MRTIVIVLVGPILLALGACSSPSYPRYQPITKGSFGAAPQQGYSEFQIDERTYLVTYQGYHPTKTGPWRHLSHAEWIAMAHDYVLYRSAELARSKGVKQFVILHGDDSDQAWRVWKNSSGRSVEMVMGFIPSARALIRLLSADRAVNVGSEEQVHDVDKLLAVLIKENAGLAGQLETVAHQENTRTSTSQMIRWRVPILIENDALERSLMKRKSSLLDADITVESHGVFGVVLWSRLPLSPLDLFRQCIKIADREGYPVFKLEDWTTEEYRPGRYWDDWNDSNAWFRTKARLVLQHQSEPNRLDPVFVVDEIRTNVLR